TYIIITRLEFRRVLLRSYCMYNDINFKNIKDIINDHYFRGFIKINDKQIHKLGYAKIIENCTSNKCFKNLYHFLSNKTHPSFVRSVERLVGQQIRLNCLQ